MPQYILYSIKSGSIAIVELCVISHHHNVCSVLKMLRNFAYYK